MTQQRAGKSTPPAKWNIGAGAVALLAALLVGGCATSAHYSTQLYHSGNYIDAEDEFDRSEAQLQQWPVEEQAAYGLYRGLTLLALGDVVRAQQWLGYATLLQRKSPAALGQEQKKELEQGWQQLDDSLRQAARAAGEPAAADPDAEQALLPSR